MHQKKRLIERIGAKEEGYGGGGRRRKRRRGKISPPFTSERKAVRQFSLCAIEYKRKRRREVRFMGGKEKEFLLRWIIPRCLRRGFVWMRWGGRGVSLSGAEKGRAPLLSALCERASCGKVALLEKGLLHSCPFYLCEILFNGLTEYQKWWAPFVAVVSPNFLQKIKPRAAFFFFSPLALSSIHHMPPSWRFLEPWR